MLYPLLVLLVWLTLCTCGPAPTSYDGPGNVVSHTITSASFLDHAGRTLSDDFKVDAGTNRKVHQLVYDQKGNVVTKYQGGTGKSDALAYLQKIDYTYLAGGLLQGININTSTGKLSGSQVGLPAVGAAATAPSPATPSSTSYDDRDLFYLELYRNQAATGIATTSFPTRANGDIVTVATQVRGRRQQLWAMTYDAYDRMRNTTFYQREHRTATPTAYGNYNEDITGYDPRGNITGLNRDDSYLVSGTYRTAWIDELEYTYESSSNRLSSVTEDSGNDRGYPNVTGSFTYDHNGNVTYDPARRVTLVYNHLNLPDRISWADGRKLEMTYDAGGTLLTRKTVAANGTTVEERHYVGGIEYVKSGSSYVLETVHHSEGRILFTGTAQEWQYTLTDHLGNTRLVYADRNGDGIVAVPSEIVQEEHYFPFGMKMTGPWMGGAAGAKTKYQYNGIEYVDAFALNVNMAPYRTLDPTIGRWWGVDPKAEHDWSGSPYGAMYNSPMVYNDPNGDCPNCIAAGIGALIGGFGNLAFQAFSGNVNSLRDGLAAFGIGALAGGAAGFTGGATLTAMGGGSTITTLGGAITQGMAVGGVGGITAGYVQGTGNALYFQNANIGDATNAGFESAIYGGLTGAVLGGLGGAISYNGSVNPGSGPNGSASGQPGTYQKITVNGQTKVVPSLEVSVTQPVGGLDLAQAAKTGLYNGRTTAYSALPRGVVAQWGKVFHYNHGGSMSAIEHITYRHSFNNGFSNTSRFSSDTSVKMIKGYVDQAVRYGNSIDGGFQYNLGRVIGTGSNGAPATSIRVFIRDGWVRSAFPVNN